MNIDFTYENPTRVHFGRKAMQHLENEINEYGKNVLLVYGKASVKKIGLYDDVINILKKNGKIITELEGIKPNPSYSQVEMGARLVRDNGIDLILAVGGGSVIDCAKAISAAAYCSGDPWVRYWEKMEDVDNEVVPIGAILTMTGTGSEMNSGSVITNEEKMLKIGRVFPMRILAPRFAILNPEYTYTVPKYQMTSGIFDIFSHLMEQYFSGDDDCVSDYLLEGDMLALINATRKSLREPHDYEARSNIAWCSTTALCKLLAVSKEQDWMVHMIEHQLGAYTDCAHGIGLAIISVPYYKHIYKYGLHRFVRFAKNIWHVDPTGKTDEAVALEGIKCLSDFIAEMGIPQRLRDVGATEEMLPKIAESTFKCGSYHICDTAEVLEILREVL